MPVKINLGSPFRVEVYEVPSLDLHVPEFDPSIMVLLVVLLRSLHLRAIAFHRCVHTAPDALSVRIVVQFLAKLPGRYRTWQLDCFLRDHRPYFDKLYGCVHLLIRRFFFFRHPARD